MEEVKKKKTYRNFTRSEKAIVHARGDMGVEIDMHDTFGNCINKDK